MAVGTDGKLQGESDINPQQTEPELLHRDLPAALSTAGVSVSSRAPAAHPQAWAVARQRQRQIKAAAGCTDREPKPNRRQQLCMVRRRRPGMLRPDVYKAARTGTRE